MKSQLSESKDGAEVSVEGAQDVKEDDPG